MTILKRKEGSRAFNDNNPHALSAQQRMKVMSGEY
jgi:hypothetical protein